MKFLLFFILLIDATSFAQVVQLTSGRTVKLDSVNAREVLHDELSYDWPELKLPLLKRCILLGADPGTVGEKGWTTLHECALKNDISYAKYLLDRGVSANILTSKNNVSPYAIASWAHHPEIAFLLLNHSDSNTIFARSVKSDRDPLAFWRSSKYYSMFEKWQDDRLRELSALTCGVIRTEILDYIRQHKDRINYKLIKFIIDGDDNVAEFERLFKERPVINEALVITDGRVAGVQVNILTLAALYNKPKILQSWFHTYENTTTVRPASDINGCTIFDFAADTAMRQLIERLNAPKKRPVAPILWRTPYENGLTVRKQNLTVRLCNVPNPESVRVFINDKPSSLMRSLCIDSTRNVLAPCPLMFEQCVNLQVGQNNILVVVQTDGTFDSFTRTVNFTPERVPEARERRRAIVVGNNSGDLDYPRRNAKDMSAVLRRIGFDVVEMKDVKEEKLRYIVDTFYGSSRNNDILFFYYAGHGLQPKNGSFFIQFIKRRFLKKPLFENFNLDSLVISRFREDGRVRISIFVVDACRTSEVPKYRGQSNDDEEINVYPALPQQGIFDQSLVKENAIRKGYLKFYSVGEGKKVADDNLFTNFLIKHLVEIGVPISTIVDEVKADIKDPDQKPEEHGDINGPFYLNPFEAD